MAKRIQIEAYFENTTQFALYDNENDLRGYFIVPNKGYDLHDKLRDWVEENPDDPTTEGVFHLGFSGGEIGVGINYDFESNPREIYAILKTNEFEAQQI